MDGAADWRHLLAAMVEAVRCNAEMSGVVKAFAILNAESLTVDHPAQSWFFERARSLQAKISCSFERGIARNEIRKDVDCCAIAAELIAIMDGLQMLWLRAPATIDMVGIFAAYVDRLIDNIAA